MVSSVARTSSLIKAQHLSMTHGFISYYRFQLPSNIPSTAKIKKAMIRLYGKDKNNNWNNYLECW